MKVLLKSLEAGLRPLSSLTITTIALCWVLALGVADYYTPGPMSFVLSYMLAVVFAGWGAGKWQAWLTSSVAMVTIVTVHSVLHRAVAQPLWIAIWNHSTRFLVFSIAGWLAAELRSLTDNLSDQVEQRTSQLKKEVEAHKATALSLSESLKRFEEVINNITEVFWLVDVAKTQMVYISPGYEHIWGRKCHELYREPGSWLAAVHPDDRDTVSRRSIIEQAAGGYDAEYRIVRPDGAMRWIRDRAFPVRNAEGDVFRIAGIADDITEQKQARQTLQMQAATLQNMAEAVVVTDQQGLIVEMNPAAERTWGYGRDEVLGKPASVFSALPEPEAVAVMRGVLEALEATGTWRGTFSNRCKDGAIITCEALISRLEIGGRVFMIAVEQDVTERLAVQEQLQLQARVLESMAEAVLMMDEKGTIMLTNPAADATLGYKHGELPGRPLRAVLNYDSEQYRRGLEKSIAQIKLKGSAARGYKAQRKDGTVIEVETRSSPVVIGGQLFIVVVGQDITQRTEAERALARKEELYRTLFELSPDGILLEDTHGNILDANQALCRSFGYAREAVVGQNVSRFVPPEHQSEVESHLAALRAGKELRHDVWNVRKNGERCLMWLNEKPLPLPDGHQGILVVARDVTETKRTESLKEAFLSLGAKLSAARSPVEAARAIYASTDLLWKSDAGVLDFWLRESNQIETVLAWDVVGGRRREVELDTPVGPPTPRTLRVVDEGELILRQSGELPAADLIPFGDVGRPSASIMSVPMRAENQTVGVFSLQSYARNAFTPADLQTLQALADYCAGALERLRAEAAVREAHDKLEQRVQERTAELRAANAALGESEARLRLALEASNAGTWSWDVGSKQSAWDDRFHEHYGFETHAPRSFEAWMAGVHPEDRERLLARIQALVEAGAGDAWNEEFRALHPAKGERWMAGLGRVERDQTGRATRFAGINLDITDRMMFDDALREAHDMIDQRVHDRTAELQAANAALGQSEERYRSLINNLNVGVYRNTPEPGGRFLQANPALARIHGYESVEEFEKVSMTELYQDPRERKRFLADLLREGTVRNYEVRLMRKDGIPIYASVSASAHRDAHGKVDWIDGMLEDITHRKKAEQSLAEALEFNRQVVSASTVGIAVYKASGRCVMANDAMAQITGGTVEQLLQQDFRRLESWHTDGLRAKAVAALDTRQPQELEGQSRTTFGRELTISARFSSFVNQGELHLLMMLTDQTTAARATHALRASEERYRTLAESSPDAIFILDRDIKVEYVNSTAAGVWGRPPGDLIGLPQSALFPPETARHHEETVRDVFATGKPVCQDEPLAFPTGEQWIEIRLAPLFDAHGSAASVMCICRDITQRKRAEQQLTEALDLNQKMLAAATMGMAAYKASGECIFANEALARSVGGSVSEVLQGNFRHLEDWERSGLLHLADEALSQGEARSAEVFAVTRFGKAVWLDCHAARFVSNGQPHLLMMALDISQRKLAERLQKALLDNIPDPAWLKDAEGRFLACNQALAVFYGLPIEALLGKTVFDIMPHEAERMTREDKKVMQARRSVVGEAPVRDARGNMRWLESIKSPLSNERDEVIGTVGIARDITSRKRAENLLQAQRDLGTSLSHTSDMAVALKHVLEITMQVGGVDAGGAYVLNECTGGMDLMAHHGGSSAFVKAVSHWAPDSPQFRLVQRCKPIFTTYQDLPFPLADPQQGEGLRGTALVPLCHEGRAIGALGLSSHMTDEIPAQTGLAIEALAAQAAGAIARIRAEAERHRLERQLLEITDREQARIGQDIHDGLCQHLVSLAFDANTLARELASQRGTQVARARRMAELADQAITETRQLARGLFPVRLESEGLPPALEELAKSTRDRFKIHCRFRSKGNVTVASSTVATHLYRIAQEAVANAVKHSQARVISIDLTAGDDKLRLKVEDDGKGLRPKTSKGADGMGLHIMDYRARSIGGTLQVTSRPHGGTKVFCCVPRPLG